jgi:hypothetical protein
MDTEIAKLCRNLLGRKPPPTLSPAAHYSEVLHGWMFGVGALFTLIVILFTCAGIATGHIKNPFAPFIRAFEKRQAHKHRMRELELTYAHKRDDPEYTAYLEKQNKQR